MEVANINVRTREELGRRSVRDVRMGGEIPAVLYGRSKDNRSLAVGGREFTKLVLTRHKLFELRFKDGSVEEAFLQDMQWDAIDDVILHVDFKRIDLNEKIRSGVEIRFVGQPKGLSKNGTFDTLIASVEVECLPRDLPEVIRLNVNDLDIDEVVQISDLPVPEGVSILVEADAVVAQCKARVEADEAEEGEGGEGSPSEPEVIGKKSEDGNEG